MDHKDCKDEELLNRIRQGDVHAQACILDRYKPLVKAKSRSYFLTGGDREDIIQEGMIGLYKAIRDFQPEKRVSFRSFAELCVNRQILSAIKAATRQKHIPLNTSVSLNRPIFEEEAEETYLEYIKDKGVVSPEAILIGQEEKNQLEAQIFKALSRFEARVLFLYLQGKSYIEISQSIQKPEKSIDNALQRIKKKIEGFIE